MPILTVHVVYSGSPYRTETGSIQRSKDGHMLFEIKGQTGKPDESWGNQPSGVIPGEANHYYHRDASISFKIDDSQAQAVRDFAELNVNNRDDNFGTWWPWNSCVDFTWAALNKAGIYSGSLIWKEGHWYPEDDVDNLRNAITNRSDFQKYIKEICEIDPVCNVDYSNARTAVPRSDPMALDLDGDGLETVGIESKRPILFDHDGDGIKTATGWIKADDGILVLDRNGNGAIDAQDACWNQLRLWRDLNLAHNAFYKEAQNKASNEEQWRKTA